MTVYVRVGRGAGRKYVVAGQYPCDGKMWSDLCKSVRRACNQPGNPCRVRVVPGDKVPELLGKPAYYTNKSGKVIDYPRAYASGFGSKNMVYHSSTRRIEVGEDWLVKQGLAIPSTDPDVVLYLLSLPDAPERSSL